MTENAGNHPDTGRAYVPVPRALDPVVKAFDLAMIEFAGPQQEQAWKFFTDFGLHGSRAEDGSLLFSAEAGAAVCVIYRPSTRARFLGPTFAVRTEQDLERLAELPGASDPAPLAIPGQPLGVSLTDPNNLEVKAVVFNDWRGLPDCGDAPLANRGADRSRVNQPRRPERCASRVLRLGHMVLGTPNWEASARFYIDTFGLIPSDVQALPDGRPAVAFMRCDRGDEPTDHHTFVVGRLPVVDIEHAAFEVPDLDSVGMGAEVLRDGGFDRAWGIGRHILGSQIFDYWFGPDGHKFEHFADGDLFDASRETRYHAMSTAGLAAWGPDVPAAFLRPRLGWHELLELIRNLFGRSGFGFAELKLMAAALRSKSLPD